jgi:hypothetical protein
LANPMQMMKYAGLEPDRSCKGIDGVICELISKVFTSRSLLHFAHWDSKRYGTHQALGELYDDIIEDLDELVECYQGKFGLVKNLYCEKASLPSDIGKRVKEEATWIEENRQYISRGDSAIESLIDILIAHYYRASYKIENLK